MTNGAISKWLWAVGFLCVAVVGLGLTLQANVLSISLNGYSFIYEEIVRHHLGEPRLIQGAVMDRRAFCGSAEVEAELHQKAEDIVCLAVTLPPASAASCSPVTSAQLVPNYVFPYFDQLTVNIAVTGHDIDEVAGFIEASSETALHELGLIDERVGSRLPAHSKNLTVTKCSGYGIVSIRQNYFAN